MDVLRRVAAAIGICIAALVSGVFGAIALAIFAVWMTPIPPGADPEFPGPGDGFGLAGPILLGGGVGFLGGVGLAILIVVKAINRKARRINILGGGSGK